MKEYSKQLSPVARIKEELEYMVSWEKSHRNKEDGTIHYSEFIMDLTSIVLDLHKNCIRLNDGEESSIMEKLPDRPKKEDFPLIVTTGETEEVIGYNMRDYAIALEVYIDLWLG